MLITDVHGNAVCACCGAAQLRCSRCGEWTPAYESFGDFDDGDYCKYCADILKERTVKCKGCGTEADKARTASFKEFGVELLQCQGCRPKSVPLEPTGRVNRRGMA
jgi:hypothetical protein